MTAKYNVGQLVRVGDRVAVAGKPDLETVRTVAFGAVITSPDHPDDLTYCPDEEVPTRLTLIEASGVKE